MLKHSEIDDTLCPLCQSKNLCGVNGEVPCWCMNEHVPKLLIEKAPQSSRNKACICQGCIKQFKDDLVKEIK